MRAGSGLSPVVRRVASGLLALALTGAGTFAAPTAARADTVRELQWHLDTLRIAQAHKQTKGRGVTVAVIDTGVDVTHPDLRGQVLAGHGVSSDAAPDGRQDSDTKLGHGTGMASIIAGRGGGDMRLLGIAPQARILPISKGSKGDTDDAAEAIRWAVDHGADVINLSVGAPAAPTENEIAAVRYALDRNVVLVASTGNREQGNDEVASPASIPGVIAVSGTTSSGRFWSGATSGPETVLAAPAEKIISSRPFSVSKNGYGVSSGTSDATAIVSGVVALVRAKYPELNAANVINRLIRTARDAGPAGRDPQYGFGSIDVLAALTASVPAVETNPLLAAPAPEDEPGRAAPGGGRNGNEQPAVSFSVKNPVLAAIQVVGCLLVVGLVIFLIVRSRRRSQRTRPVAAPHGTTAWPPAPGPAPPGQPQPGAAPPVDYPPPPGGPGTYHPAVPPPASPLPGGPPPPAPPNPGYRH